MDLDEKNVANRMKENSITTVIEYHVTTSDYLLAMKAVILADRVSDCSLTIPLDTVYSKRGDYLWKFVMLWAKQHGAKYLYDTRTGLAFTVK